MKFLLLMVWILPASGFKNFLLRILGHKIDRNARVGSNLVWDVHQFEVNGGAAVGRFNVFRCITRIHLKSNAFIGNYNFISSSRPYVRWYGNRVGLFMDEGSKIITRHKFDCSGGIHIGEMSSVAGNGSLFLTHSTDIENNWQSALPIYVGKRSFVGARSLLLGGATLPDNSVLGAGSVLTRCKGIRNSGLWGGVPARWIAPVEGLWFSRVNPHTWRLNIPDSNQVIEDLRK